MIALRLVHMFSKVKPLKAVAVTTDKGVKFTSQTDSSTFQITNAQQALLGSLAACETAAIRALTREGKLKINKINFKKMQSSYNLENFMKGGKDNHMEAINMQVDFETNGTQKDLDQLHKKVQNQCPIYCTLTAAGIKINSKWNNVSK